jgi:hypothetical protein
VMHSSELAAKACSVLIAVVAVAVAVIAPWWSSYLTNPRWSATPALWSSSRTSSPLLSSSWHSLSILDKKTPLVLFACAALAGNSVMSVAWQQPLSCRNFLRLLEL